MYLHEGNAVPRWHAPRGGGAEVVRRLVAAAEERGVEIRCDARVSSLLTEDGAVTGVEVDGEALHADAVLVADRGFTGSPELVGRHGPDAGPGSRVLLGGAPSATGDGLALLASVDAAFVGLDRLWIYPYGTPDDLDPTGTRGMAARGVRNEIWVNADGRRFHDENLRGGATGTPALLAQRPATCWSIFDDDEARLLTLTHPGYGTDEEPDRAAVATFLERSPFAHRAATLADLARSAGLPAEALEATVGEYNEAFGGDRRAATRTGATSRACGRSTCRRTPRSSASRWLASASGASGPTCPAACRASREVRSPGCTPPARSPAWREDTSTGEPRWRGRCSVRVSLRTHRLPRHERGGGSTLSSRFRLGTAASSPPSSSGRGVRE